MPIKEKNKIKTLLFNVSGVWVSEALTLIILFLIQMTSAKFLGPIDYGLFAALNSITTVFTALSHGIRVAFARTIADNLLREVRVPFYLSAMRLPIIGGFVTALLLIIVAPLIFNVLDFSKYQFVFLIALNFPVVILVVILMGVMQGSQNFKFYSFVIVLQSITRLIFVLIGLVLKFGVGGLLWAILLSNALTAAVACFLCIGTIKSYKYHESFSAYKNTNIGHASFLIVALIISMHASVDVFLARQAFGQSAGNYAMIALISKVVLYAPMGIVFVSFPKIVLVRTNIDRVREMFFTAIAISCLVSIFMTLMILGGIEVMVDLIYGPLFQLNKSAVFLYCLGMIFLGLSHQVFSLILALSSNNRFIYQSAFLFVFGFIVMGMFARSEFSMSGFILFINVIVFLQLCPSVFKILRTGKVTLRKTD